MIHTGDSIKFRKDKRTVTGTVREITLFRRTGETAYRLEDEKGAMYWLTAAELAAARVKGEKA